jgi:hypothetical protein
MLKQRRDGYGTSSPAASWAVSVRDMGHASLAAPD